MTRSDRGLAWTLTRALIVAWTLCSAPAWGDEDWARKLFSETSHDFRTVGRGANAEYHFAFRNPYKEEVRVASVRTSCGCTTPTVTKNLLASGETSTVVAKFNTQTHIGEKSATITVVFDRPYYAEVQLKVRGYIRTDITFNPPEVNFGEFAAGEEKRQQILVTHSGSGSWEIRDVRSVCGNLAVTLDAPERTTAGVRYRMTVMAKPGMPEGDIRERLTLITSDPQFPAIDMAVTGRVRPSLEVSPASLGMGTIPTSTMVERRLLVRAEEPFRIQEVVAEDPRFQFDVPATSAKLHFVKVRFTADGKVGNSAVPIRIKTDLAGGKQTECLATVTIEP